MHRDQWTAALVVAELVKAFKSGKGYGIALYSPARNRLEPIDGSPVEGLRLIERTADCLGRETEDRHRLLAYARASAQRKVAELCSAKGWNRRTLYYARDRAAAAVAACLNDAYRAGHDLSEPLTIAQLPCPRTGQRGQLIENKREKDARPA